MNQDWAAKAPRATIKEVARRSGVALVTVSRVLNDTGPVSPDVRRRVHAAIAELGFVPSALAQGLKIGSTRTLGLLLPDVTNPFFGALAGGVEAAAHAAGYSLILCGTWMRGGELRDEYLDVLRRKRVDGIVLAAVGEDPAPVLEWRRRHGPVCLVDRSTPGLPYHEASIDLVRDDTRTASERLVAHVLSHGHRRVGIVNAPLRYSTAADRYAGYRQALASAGLSPDPALERHIGSGVKEGYDAATALLVTARPPTAIFATNNFLTVGVLTALRDHGVRVPDDVAVVGFDQTPPLPQAALWASTTTVVAQPAEAIGRRAAACLLERIALGYPENAAALRGRDVVLDAEVVIRRSCGCPGPAASAAAERAATGGETQISRES